MNLLDLCAQLKPSDDSACVLPRYLLGAFRRKSITFSNGLTDENTLVYWFQSKTFTIDLRLKDPISTPVLERQGWVGDTIWDAQNQLLSWNVSSNYQNHVQWPEPAKLYSIGNAILEFSPSHAYVEDWRQQATRGLYLGLRLFKVENIDSSISYPADGGFILCDHFIAFAKSRHPDIQQAFHSTNALKDAISQQQISLEAIQDYEVSISFDKQIIDLSTISNKVGTMIDLENFQQLDHNTLVQQQLINGEHCRLFFTLDVFQKDFCFTTLTGTSTESQNWFDHEENHLFHHAKIAL